MHFPRLFFITLFLSISFVIISDSCFALNGADDNEGKISSQNKSGGHFSNTRIAFEKSSTKYYQDAVIDFTTKLNTAIRGHIELKSLSESCGGCDVVKNDFDEYIRNHLPQKDYGIVVTQFFNSSVSGQITSRQRKLLNDLIAGMLKFIIEDANYLIQSQEGIVSMGKYSDGDAGNSPYDLMTDMRKIWGIFFKNNVDLDGYMNTADSDASGLITGRFEVGSWASGKNYEIDLASDIASAFGQNLDTSSTPLKEKNDCDDGFCITLEMMDNNQSVAHRGGTAFIDKNLEEIFGSALDWLIQKGDKRNLACKGPPPVNHFQSNNDQNLSFKNIFRGLGIFVFEKTPKYAVSNNESSKVETLEQKKKTMDGIIASSFKSRNVDPDNLMLYTQKQMIEEATPLSSSPSAVVSNQADTARRLTQRQSLERSAFLSESSNEYGNIDDGTKNMFRSFASGMHSFNTMVRDMLGISKAWRDKPDCEN